LEKYLLDIETSKPINVGGRDNFFVVSMLSRDI
jgi:hypothetical protein